MIVPSDFAPFLIKIVDLRIAETLHYIQIRCYERFWKVAAAVLLLDIAELAGTSGAVLQPLLFRCGGHWSEYGIEQQAPRLAAAEKAIAAWKEKRGIEVPKVIAQSWLECECRYW